MAKIREITINVTSVTDNVIKIKTPDGGMEISKELITQLSDASLHDPNDTLIRNIAINLSIGEVDLNDGAKVKTHLDGQKFKMVTS